MQESKKFFYFIIFIIFATFYADNFRFDQPNYAKYYISTIKYLYIKNKIMQFCKIDLPKDIGQLSNQINTMLKKNSRRQTPQKRQHSINVRKGTSINNFHKRLQSNKHQLMQSQQSFLVAQLEKKVNSASWILHDSSIKKTYGVRYNLEREIASLTKIMTCIVVLEIMQKNNITHNLMIKITKASVNMIGTSANLIQGHWIKLIDLLHGLMLPSGNDAAYLLAQSFGLLLFYSRIKQDVFQDIESIDLTYYQSTNHFVNQFIKTMNKKAKQLNLLNTSFSNPHGLSTVSNYSSAKDLLELSLYCKENKLFMQIVSCKQYKAYLQVDQFDEGNELYWKNTNKLLQYGWQGIKTGQTQTAGCCLASMRDGILIVVLNSPDPEMRFQDTINIWEWYTHEKVKKQS